MRNKLEALLKNKNQLLMLVLAGILLMVISLPVRQEKTTEGGESAQSTGTLSKASGEGSASEPDIQGALSETEAYMQAMEEKVEKLLSRMEGAGEVKVILTWKTSVERIVEKDLSTVRSNTAEEDSQGGTRLVNELDSGETTVLSNQGSNAEPYVVKTLSPTVEGVLVLAQGAGEGAVSSNLSDAVQVLFGVGAHQVKVIRMAGDGNAR